MTICWNGCSTRDNLWAAWLAVKANRGAPGIDGIGTEETAAHLRRHWSGIKGKLLAGTYKPAPVRPVRIPKPGGGERGLGIPNTTDRLIQQALHQTLSRFSSRCSANGASATGRGGAPTTRYGPPGGTLSKNSAAG